MGLWYIYNRYYTCYHYYRYNKLIMKHLLLILILPIYMIGQEVRCDIIVTKDGVKSDDTLTVAEVINVTTKMTIFVPANNLYLYLMPECEYMITFNRSGCVTKELYIFTNSIPKDGGEYIIKVNVEMLPGNESTVINTVAWYDKQYDNFRYKPSSDTLIKNLYKK